MTQITLSATPKGNGFQATVTYANGVSVSSAEAFPTRSEAISAAARKLLDMPERMADLDDTEEADGIQARHSLMGADHVAGAEQKERRKP